MKDKTNKETKEEKEDKYHYHVEYGELPAIELTSSQISDNHLLQQKVVAVRGESLQACVKTLNELKKRKYID